MADWHNQISRHHASERLYCEECKVPWPCQPFVETRRLVDRNLMPQLAGPSVIYPERAK
jgi:hypothetical protein